MKWWKQQQQQQSVIPYEQLRAETLAQLGATLSRKRQEKKLTLEDIEAQTRIRSRYLQAIEAGKLDELPEPVYTQGFIRRYADALGLNGIEMANSFPTGDRQQNLIKPIGLSLPATQLSTTHLYLIYILVIVGSVTALSQILGNSESASNSQSETRPVVSSATKPQAASAQKLKTVNTSPKPAKKTNKPVEVGVTVKAESWIRVIADGKQLFEGLLPQGTQRTWVANDRLTMRVGNAGGVFVSHNEEEAKPLGTLGQVEEVTFGADTRL